MASKNYSSEVSSSPLDGGSQGYVDALYEVYLQDPNAVGADWKAFFEALPATANANGNGHDISHQAIREQFLMMAKHRGHTVVATEGAASSLDARVAQLVNAYRKSGHLHADLDPLALTEKNHARDLELSYYDLDSVDPNTEVDSGDFVGLGKAPLKDIVAALNQTYANNIGVEYMHVMDHEQTQWIQSKLESTHAKPQFDKAKKLEILDKMIAAEGLEKYLGSKYVGQKRFGLEGGDSLIPGLDAIIHSCGKHNVKETVVGMAHRGRLNVLVNILGKDPAVLFDEFEGKNVEEERSGDVKYHMGFSSDVVTDSKEVVHLTLAFNPSHLEIIDPVVEGSVRARQRRREDYPRNQVVPILIHGDAAFAGQGVVMETFCLSQARGYKTGGTVHLVINNQIGFTTSNPLDARSSLYCSDAAKMVRAPIFHVNGDDPEAVVFMMELAFEYRMRFNRDVVVDLICYRRHGHNEADEPSVTQPMMYKKIKAHPTPCKIYSDKLIAEGVLTDAEYKERVKAYRNALEGKGQHTVVLDDSHYDEFAVDWKPFLEGDLREEVDTTISSERVLSLGQAITRIPDGFKLQPLVKRELDNRQKMASGELPMNWGFAENMAYASLVTDNYQVRLSGQDCGRGTFAHRYAELYDQNNGDVYIPLCHIDDKQSHFIVINSLLSEEAVLGFEYGFATADPMTLVLWEAQFGDFANGAQVVFDQFISSGEQKWGRMCGLTVLLPHGYEGMGPEHSSARLERYLQLCAQHNIQVCVPSTPAQIFHLLRRQMVRKARKPLIVMTPKSLLRHKLAVSPVSDLSDGKFHCVIPEIDNIDNKKVTRAVLCSGKVYYDLLEHRREKELNHVAILRVEQLYPYPDEEVKAELKKYPKLSEVVWCQEEPMNQGAWYQTQHRTRAVLSKGQILSYAGRPYSASPAVGYASIHKRQQQQLVLDALEGSQ